MKVYRYMPLKWALDSLQKKRLRIGRLVDLNDPYDCWPRITNVPGMPPEGSNAFEKGYLGGFSEAFGLVSYSATVSDPVIWSHYADSHRGMALEFEYTDPSDGLTEVRYNDDRKTFDHSYLEDLKARSAVAAMFHVIQDGFTVKALSWSYEKEYRQFIFLESCTPEDTHYFRPFPVPRLTAVILGTRCCITKEDVARTLRSGGYPDSIEARKASMDPIRYRIIA